MNDSAQEKAPDELKDRGKAGVESNDEQIVEESTVQAAEQRIEQEPISTLPVRVKNQGARQSPATSPLKEADAPSPPFNDPLTADPGIEPAVPQLISRKAIPVGNRLPAVAPAADLGRPRLHWGWSLLCFTITFVVYVALVPRFVMYSSPPTGDQPFYLMDTLSMVQDRDLNVANNYAQRDEDKFYRLAPRPDGFVGMGAPYPLPKQLAQTVARPPDENYAFHLPGLSIMLIPSWIIGSWFQLWWPATVVFMCFLGALLSLNIFLLAFETTGKLWIAWAVWLPLAFSNPLMSYAYLLFTEMPVGLFAIYAFRRLAQGWHANGPGRTLLVGALLAYIPWLAFRCVIFAAPIAFYGLYQWVRYYRANRRERLAAATPGSVQDVQKTGFMQPIVLPQGNPLLKLALYLGPMLLSGVLLLWFNFFLFGRPLPDMKVPELGDASPFYWPWAGGEQATKFITNAFALLFDRQMGLLTNAPIYLLAVVGIIAMFRSYRKSDRRLLLWIAIVALPYAGVLAAFHFWSGIWGPPARYQTSLVPLLAAPMAMSLFAFSKSWIYKIIYVLLALPGLALMAIRMYDARMLWPSVSTWEWIATAKESPIKVDLRNLLPSFVPLESVRLPLNTALLTGIAIAIVALSYFLLLRSKTLRPQRRMPYAVHGVMWGLMLAVVWGSWYTVSAEFLKPRTVLTELSRWSPSVPFQRPQGIAYMNNSIYVADTNERDPGNFFRLDLATGQFNPIVPLDAGVPMSYTRPAGVAAGPDGLIYLLNNDLDRNALWAMTPSGEIQRKIALNSKSLLSMGITFAPDGTMYVGDIGGSKALKYRAEGGDPVLTFSPERGSYNNIVGVALSPDGKELYVAEASALRIQVMETATGRFLRDIKLDCTPHHIAVPPGGGDWADVSCNEKGMLSVNMKTKEIRRVSTTSDKEPLGAMGIAYGPDGTLYVMEGGQLVVYKVQR